MNKKILALKILLPVLILSLVALVSLEIKCLELHDSDNEEGLLFIVALVLNIIPIIAMIIAGALLLIDTVLLFAVRKKLPAVIMALVVLCLLTPFVGFSTFVDISTLSTYIEVPIVAVITCAVTLTSLVFCCIYIDQIRRSRKSLPAEEDQV